ncbi:MAG: hypothetical protein M0Q54_07535 [Pigmentiphaga sp.]|nr:hypothetical protein [Pigmentiphaga sp.]
MNAVMHRDYQSNTPIRLYQFDDRIEILNAGGLYGNARPENFPNVNDYRNPIISESMKVLGYVNRFSRGVVRVNEELLENGNGEADFNFDLITAFEVTVRATTPQVTPQATPQVTEQVTPQVLTLIDIMSEGNYYLREDLQKILKLKDRENFRLNYLKPALDIGFVEMTIPEKPRSSLQQYRLTDKGVNYLTQLKER